MLEKRWRVCEQMQGHCGVLEFIPCIFRLDWRTNDEENLLPETLLQHSSLGDWGGRFLNVEFQTASEATDALVSPSAKSFHSQLNSQSFPCVFTSHDYAHVWAHQLNMQHLPKGSFFSFSDQDPLRCWTLLLVSEHDCPFWPQRHCFASPW